MINVGVYPPPYGGVSIHLQRLCGRLRAAGAPVRLIDLAPDPAKPAVPGVEAMRWAAAVRRLVRAPRAIVHFHNFTPRNALLYAALGLRHRTVLSFHNERFVAELATLPRPAAAVVRRALERLDCIVVDSEDCLALARGLVRDPGRLRLIPEYLDPPAVPPLEEPAIVALRERHRYLLGSNAFRISFHDGQDLYGIDLLIELLHRLVTLRRLDVAMAFLLPAIGDDAYFARLQARVAELGLTDRFRFVTRPIAEATSLWRACDAVIRATNTDGNSLTVLEALSAGTPVVASDCVGRPAGTVLFRTRDVDDLERQVADVLERGDAHRRRLGALGPLDNGDRFLDLYRTLGMTTER
ncbi:MAG TPA: glycosyltransferase family 4 protein [Gemmatimonadales bacterium]|nr:glycosyltransferase family 4 protein [Gemmatimonadales bacterium]